MVTRLSFWASAVGVGWALAGAAAEKGQLNVEDAACLHCAPQVKALLTEFLCPPCKGSGFWSLKGGLVQQEHRDLEGVFQALQQFPILAAGFEGVAAARWCLHSGNVSALRVTFVSTGVGESKDDNVVPSFIACALYVAAWLQKNEYNGLGYDDGMPPAGASKDAVLEAEGWAAASLGRYFRVMGHRLGEHCLEYCDGELMSLEHNAKKCAEDTASLSEQGNVPRPITIQQAMLSLSNALIEAVRSLREKRPCVPWLLRLKVACVEQQHHQSSEGSLGALLQATAVALLALRLECGVQRLALSVISSFLKRVLRLAQVQDSPMHTPIEIRQDCCTVSGPKRTDTAEAALKVVLAACSPASRRNFLKMSKNMSRGIDSSRTSTCIASTYLGEKFRERWLNRTLANKKRYGAKYGHPVHVLEDTLCGPSAYHDTIDWARRLLHGCSVVFVSEADVVFTAEAPSLDAILHLVDPSSESDLVVTEDVRRPPVDPQHGAVNTGNIFVRSTPCGRAILNAIGALGEDENDPYWCVGHLGTGQQYQCDLAIVLFATGLGRTMQGAIQRVPHRTFNSLVCDGDFKCSDPVLHYPGCRTSACADHLVQVCPLA
eukprot:TRINITY_DN75991_c0_g1_i1.p1 TRINITY_DN75991_c0_g1~~TRINITY_DN75991_c0_g1_i1.p1  ORF type:complete len:604 (-),score=52.08 TRINITY_DN75991_c0_g1_i1:211-2022(-)